MKDREKGWAHGSDNANLFQSNIMNRCKEEKKEKKSERVKSRLLYFLHIELCSNSS